MLLWDGTKLRKEIEGIETDRCGRRRGCGGCSASGACRTSSTGCSTGSACRTRRRTGGLLEVSKRSLLCASLLGISILGILQPAKRP